MNRKSVDRRLAVVQRAINSQPMSMEALDELYTRLLDTGDLPTERRFACAVLERALRARRGCKPTPWRDSAFTAPPREQVFREAVHSFEPVRQAARLLIGQLVDAGLDPSDPEFVPSDCELTEFGSAALHLLGWPDRWVRAPHECQMQRVMRQHARLREDEPRGTAWYREAANALGAFLREGRMPRGDDLRLFVLTSGEMFALQAHYFGHGDEELIAAFEAVVTTAGPGRDEALAHLGQLQVRATRDIR